MSDTFDESISSARTYELATAPPPPSRAPRVWAGAILLLAGLGLIVLAGCFLIGDILLIADPVMPGEEGFMHVLFLLLLVIALCCLAGAGILFVLAVRGLLRIMNE